MRCSARNIAILGSTGSIGRSALEVIRANSECFRATVLSGHSNIALLLEQIREFHPAAVVVRDPSQAEAVRRELGPETSVYVGAPGLEQAVCRDDVDVVLNALVGFAGLRPTVAAIQHQKSIALANKETLVVGGDMIMRLLAQHGVQLVPVDSEHSAIFQCLAGESPSSVTKVILTASGGPFRDLPAERFVSITVAEALKHPNWAMGPKITVDSATLMNKGLEVIEAHWLFGLSADRITVVIHPQSIVHSMVEFIDGSVKAQLGLPDMKLPIQYALSFPERWPMNGPRVDFPKLRSMDFFEPDEERFPCLGLAYEALREGGTAPVILNAANEVAVAGFLEGSIAFLRIPQLIRQALEHEPLSTALELEHILDADRSARAYVRSQLS